MPSPTSNLVLAVLLLTAAIAAAKLVGAAVTGSGALLAEFIHSIAAATSQALMLVAMRRAPETDRAAGELRFWAVVVPILVYSLGAGVALNEGTAWLLAPRVLADLPTGLAILAAILGVQAMLVVLIRRRPRSPGTVDRTVLHTLETECLASSAGAAAALGGLAAAHVFGTVESDAVAAVTVGLLMGAVSATMALATRKLLTGTDAMRAPGPAADAIAPAEDQASATIVETASSRPTAPPPGHKNHPPPKQGKKKRR